MTTAQARPRAPKGDPLYKTPAIAWPTVFLFLSALALWGVAIVGAESGWWPTWLSVLLITIAIFANFTVLHDGVHRSLMRGHPRLNDIIASAAGFTITPVGSCAVFRLAHFTHHRHTNEPENDPDMWSGVGPKWLMPLRWMTADFGYIRTVWDQRGKLSLQQRLSVAVIYTVIVGAYVSSWLLGYGVEATLYWLLPSRLAALWLAFAFNYLPHHPHTEIQAHNPYAATNVRRGGEPLMKWLFLYQNYHLIHHLFPSVPFYRYQKIWQENQSAFIDKGAPVVAWNRIEAS